MNTTLKLAAIAALLVCAAASGLSAGEHHGRASAGPVTTEQRTVPAFTAIEASGPYQVVVHVEGAPSLSVTGPAQALANLETAVVDGTLVLRPRSHPGGIHMHFGAREPDTVITVTVPALAAVKVHGSGDMTIDHLNAERFVAAADGSGDLDVAGTVRDLQLTSTGSGDVDLDRLNAVNADLQMHSSGDVRVAGLTGDLKAELTGSGDLAAHRLRVSTASVQLHSSGGASLSGSAGSLNTGIDGSGDLDACSLDVRTATANLDGSGTGCVGGHIARLDAQVHGSGDLDVRGLSAAAVKLVMTNAGNVQLRGDTDTLDAELSGSGDLSATLHGKRAQLRMEGAGGALLDGSVDDLVARLSGSGELDGENLVATRSDVHVDGAGQARVGGHAGKLAQLTVDRHGQHWDRDDD